ncbi:MAG: AAA family ATPase [Chlorobiaceae bacterium]
MAIERISKIKKHRIFRGFVWPSDLLDFSLKNLFYGWNGTGKSTLSNLFRSIEKRTNISEGEVEFVISGNKVDGLALSTTQGLPQVRVFNKDFIFDNVFTSHGSVAPIFFLGEENIEKQKKVEKLRGDLDKVEIESRNKETEKRRAEKTLDDFKKERAKSIKDLLSSSGGNNQYNNYDKRSYQVRCDEMLKFSDTEQKAKILDESDLDAQKKKKESTPLDKLQLLKFSYPDTLQLTDQVVALLKKTVVSLVIETLKNDQELSGWVKTGLVKHKKDHSIDCLFCGQPLPEGRIDELESHFNDKYNLFIGEIESLSVVVKSAIDSLKLCTPPNRFGVYDHLKNEFDSKCQDLSNEISGLNGYLENLLTALQDKSQKPFQPIERSFDVVIGNVSVISDLNVVISKQNQETDDFQPAISAARTAIEDSLVAQSLMEYQQKNNDVDEVAAALQKASDKATALKTEILEIEKDIEEHRRPADELNADIYSYLGRDELAFEIQGNGYQISRNGAPAKNLSEGEKTAIAFLYFLKSLSDKSFSLENGIVVIDDPISSLDSNSIYHAYGFMKERTKNAGQLFVLTHNFTFFQQVKKWLSFYKKNERCFYMLEAQADTNGRYSNIKLLDSLLENYESEYQYLYSIVWKCANGGAGSLSDFYQMPNIARRLLESFLSFRQPQYNSSVSLDKRMQDISFNEAKTGRILRFTNTLSHNRYVEDQPGNDLSILSESPAVLSDLLSLMNFLDADHCNAMENAFKKNT